MRRAAWLLMKGGPARPGPAMPKWVKDDPAEGYCGNAATIVLLACRANKIEPHADKPR